MADHPRFRNVFYKLGPRWLVGEGDGERVLYSLGLVEDMWMDRLKQGLEARFPELAPSDALGVIGRDRKIVRGRDEEDEAYAVRLLRYLDDWKRAGNPFALMQQVRAYINEDIRLRTVDNRGNWYTLDSNGEAYLLDQGNWDWDGDADKWARFWLIIYSTGGVPWSPLEWGDPALTWGLPGLTWGSTATSDEVASVRAIVRDWKPAGTTCKNIIIAFDSAAFDPTDPPGAPLPDGTWGRHGIDGVTASRDPRAIYWKGTA